MMVNGVPVHPGDSFSWTSKRGVVEASSLEHPVCGSQGFYVQSHKTGALRLFSFDRTDTDGTVDDEIVAWVYKSGDIEVHILND